MAKNLFTQKNDIAFNNYRNSARGQQLDIRVGPRYVFFDSLRNQKSYIYLSLYGQGMSYVHRAESQLSKNKNMVNNSTSQSLSKMQQYVNFIDQMAEKQLSNEKSFLENLQKRLKQDGKLTKKLQSDFNKFWKDPGDYLKLIALLNETLQQQTKQQREIDKIYLQNAQLIESKIKEMQQAKKKNENQNTVNLEQLFHTNIHLYNQQVNKLVRSIEQNNKWKSTYVQLLSRRINTTITSILHNKQFIQYFESIYPQTQNTSIQSLAGKIISYVVQELSKLSFDELSTQNKDQIADTIIKSININKLNQISNNYVDLIMNQVTQRNHKQRSIEQIALTTGRGTARFYSELTKAQRDEIYKQYFSQLDKKDLNIIKDFEKKVASKKGIKNVKASQLGKISKIMNTAVRKRMSQLLDKKVLDDIKEKTTKFSKDLIKTTDKLSALEKALSVKISGPSVGEIQTSKEINKAFQDILQDSYTPGNLIKLKNDITILIDFDQHTYSNNTNVEIQLQNLVTNFPKSFIKRYAEKSGGAQNVAAAADVYIEQAKNVLAAVKSLREQNLIDEQTERQFLISLKDYIIGGISVKEYTYTTNYGFHGGTIGSKLSSVVDNVTNMYNLGGISSIDADLLYFAIANCGEAMLGKGLREDIETYLLGAAATMMFDEGFTSSKEFLDRMKNELGFNGPSGLHLFKVSGKYIPASLIYQNISVALHEAIGDIITNVSDIVKNSRSSIHINNTITRNNIPSFYNVPDPQDRWDAVAALAEDILNGDAISYTFLAGILDIFEAIPNAFSKTK